MGLNAVGSIDVIRKAFNTGIVDITVAGDLEDVEIKLGLRTRRETPQPNYSNFDFEDLASNIDSVKAKKKKIGRNAPCPCGSGKKYNKCCLNKNS
jgi:preprotein translocase subunit SecA